MHVHGNQINPNVQLDAMYAAQKAEAKRAAERTRKKLLELASEAAGDAEAEASVVRLGAREEAGGDTKQRDQRQSQGKKPDANEGQEESSISDWA